MASPTTADGTPDVVSKALDGLTLALVGPGRVGTSLVHWSTACGARLLRVSGRQRASAEGQGLLSAGVTWQSVDRLTTADADLLLVAVSDPSLTKVACRLATRAQAPVVLHTAGSVGAEALAPLRTISCAVGTLHPLRAFTNASHDLSQAAGTLFTLDGDSPAITMASRLVEAFSARWRIIDAQQRTLYHLAASLAAGGVVTLLAIVDQLRELTGLPDDTLRDYLRLSHGALDQIAIGPTTAAAITGPAARGDQATVERQLQAIEAQAPELLPLLRELMRTSHRLAHDAIDP